MTPQDINLDEIQTTLEEIALIANEVEAEIALKVLSLEKGVGIRVLKKELKKIKYKISQKIQNATYDENLISELQENFLNNQKKGGILPPNYEFCDRGIIKKRIDLATNLEEITLVSRTKMLITGYTINIKTGDHGSILKYQSYHSGLNFKEIMLPNETLSSTQKILQLSRFGISVTSKLAPEIVDYLDAQKSASKVYLIQAYLVPNTGWFKYKIVGFALG